MLSKIFGFAFVLLTCLSVVAYSQHFDTEVKAAHSPIPAFDSVPEPLPMPTPQCASCNTTVCHTNCGVCHHNGYCHRVGPIRRVGRWIVERRPIRRAIGGLGRFLFRRWR